MLDQLALHSFYAFMDTLKHCHAEIVSHMTRGGRGGRAEQGGPLPALRCAKACCFLWASCAPSCALAAVFGIDKRAAATQNLRDRPRQCLSLPDGWLPRGPDARVPEPGAGGIAPQGPAVACQEAGREGVQFAWTAVGSQRQLLGETRRGEPAMPASRLQPPPLHCRRRRSTHRRHLSTHRHRRSPLRVASTPPAARRPTRRATCWPAPCSSASW